MNADDPVATNPARHNNYPDVEDNHGKAGLNIVYCDGHAAWLPTRNPFAEWNLSFDDNRATFDDFYVSKSGYNSTVPRPFGYTGPAPTLRIERAGGQWQVVFEGKLQESATVPGTWTDVPGATLPYALTTAGQCKFFRAVCE